MYCWLSCLGALEFVEQTIELQKKQNWIKANKLILNSSLASNPQMRKVLDSYKITVR